MCWRVRQAVRWHGPSMKVPPKRKGNWYYSTLAGFEYETLNESPSEKEGKCSFLLRVAGGRPPSMKVPPKRKGNTMICHRGGDKRATLNESPSEKEGKSTHTPTTTTTKSPSMKVPPNRKGNQAKTSDCTMQS